MLGIELWDNKCGSMHDLVKSYMAISLAFNSHSLRLRLGNCRVSLVEGVSCVWNV